MAAAVVPRAGHACLWSVMAAAGPLPVAAASPKACVLGVPAPVAWTWSEREGVVAAPALEVPTLAAEAPNDSRPWTWSRLAATAADPAAAASPSALVVGTVASKAMMVASERMTVAAAPAAAAVPRTMAGVANDGAGLAGIPCLWSMLAGLVPVPSAAASPNAWVDVAPVPVWSDWVWLWLWCWLAVTPERSVCATATMCESAASYSVPVSSAPDLGLWVTPI